MTPPQQRYLFDSGVVEPKPRGNPHRAAVTVRDLVEQYLEFATQRYQDYHAIRAVLNPLKARFGEWPADDFKSAALLRFREELAQGGWSRGYLNRNVNRLRAMFRWGEPRELVAPSTVASLKNVPSLKPGESKARETRPREALPQYVARAIRELLKQPYLDFFDLLLTTAARPGELCRVTTGMIDRSTETWKCPLAQHKTRHHGKRRALYFNGKAQDILQRHLRADPAARLFPFSPRAFAAAFRPACFEALGMPEELRREPRFLTADQRVARKQWCERFARVPYELRHTAATLIVDEIGLEPAQQLLGHSSQAMTEHYSRASEAQAIQAVKRLG